MEKPSHFWTDEREADLKDRLEALGADERFIRFLWNEHCPTWVEDQIIPRIRGKGLQSYMRKEKRRLQKAYPEEWRRIWQEECLPQFKASRNEELHFRSGPAGSEIATVELVRRRGRPRKAPPGAMGVVWLLQAYFRRLSDRPCWRAIAEILAKYSGHDYGDYHDLQSAWQNEKTAFKEGGEWDADVFLESYLRLYERRFSPQAAKEC